MNTNWFEDGQYVIFRDIAEALGLETEKVFEVYSALGERGLTDYDVETEIFYKEVFGEELNEGEGE